MHNRVLPLVQAGNLARDLFRAARVRVDLMVSGRLRWRDAGATVPKRRGLAAFDFRDGTVLFTEEGTKKRASILLHVRS